METHKYILHELLTYVYEHNGWFNAARDVKEKTPYGRYIIYKQIIQYLTRE